MPSAIARGEHHLLAARQTRDHADGIPQRVAEQNQVADLQARRASDRRAVVHRDRLAVRGDRGERKLAEVERLVGVEQVDDVGRHADDRGPERAAGRNRGQRRQVRGERQVARTRTRDRVRSVARRNRDAAERDAATGLNEVADHQAHGRLQRLVGLGDPARRAEQADGAVERLDRRADDDGRQRHRDQRFCERETGVGSFTHKRTDKWSGCTCRAPSTCDSARSRESAGASG